MNVKIKLTHPDAKIPTYAKEGDAGMDLTAVSKSYDEYGNVVYGFGLAFEIPTGYVGLIFPRSSVCKQRVALTNAVAVIDSGFRGEVTAKFKPTSMFRETYDGTRYVGSDLLDIRDYEIGERVAQIIILPYPHIEFKEVEELSKTDRGEGGYGSSGR